ncbi:MAG TPA: F0F1 ATP synthase subunit B [Steroidobacteraceae bacterium]|nr:F0F1 ATP synthase subunit B [Steroidobacteraceae bacterium]
MVNINLTLIIQMVVFALLVWFTMRFVWPYIMAAVEERGRKIALGLAAAEKGEQELAAARERADAVVREARERATQIIDHAQHRANDLLEQARGTASSEGARLIAAAQQQIELDAAHARETLRRQVAGIAVGAAAKLLGREIDARAHADLLERLAAQI